MALWVGQPLDIGEDFPTLREAEAHAAIVANELGRNNPQPVTVFVLSPDVIPFVEHSVRE
jgi:hypothetical protein